MDSAADGGRRYNRLRRRRVFVLALVVLVVVSVAGALLIASTIKSPAQQAAQAKAPAQTLLTVPVQKTVLVSTVLAQAVVSPPREFSPSIIGGGGSAGQDVQQIVTKIYRRKGSYIGQGSVILEVAGQPFFVLAGTVPAYRDLEPGESGTDVSQLQQDLASLGYGLGSDTLGVFGSGTSAAVDAYYHAVGYTAPQLSRGPKADRGAMIPLGQYSFVPRLPARIVKLGMTVGQSAKGSGLVLSLGSPSVAGQLSPSSAGLVRRGMLVTITEPGGGAAVRGRVTSVARSTASTKSISGGLYVALGIRPDHSLPLSLVGQDVSVAIATARSSGPVLTVPEAAVFAGVDGGIYVTKMSAAGRVRVPVRVGLSGDGLLQVTPQRAGALAAGDQVIIGQGYADSPAAGQGAVRRGGSAQNAPERVTPAGGGG